MDETTLKEDLQKIDQVIELHKGKLEDGKKLERLMKNQDFPYGCISLCRRNDTA